MAAIVLGDKEFRGAVSSPTSGAAASEKWGVGSSAGASGAALGSNAVAGASGVAVGGDADGNSLNGVAIGRFSVVSSRDSVSIGRQAAGVGRGAVSIGSAANVANAGVAIGELSDALGLKSVAVGHTAQATDDGAVAIGDQAASVINGVAIGASSAVTHANSVSIGAFATSGGASECSIGAVGEPIAARRLDLVVSKDIRHSSNSTVGDQATFTRAEQVIDLSVSPSTSGLIPTGALRKGVSSRVLTTITGGATGVDTGDGTDIDRYGANTGVAAGTTTTPADFTVNPDPPEFLPSGGDVTLTGVGGAMTGGTVRVVAWYETFTAPTR